VIPPIHSDIRRRVPEQIDALEPRLKGVTVMACTGSSDLLGLALLVYRRIEWWANSIGALLALSFPQEGPVLLGCTDDLPDGSVLSLVQRLRQRLGQRPLQVIAVLDARTDALRLQALQQEGVQALCCKDAVGNGQMLTALTALLHGGSFVDEGFAAQLRQPSHSGSRFGSPSCLTRRERLVLEQLSVGFNSDEIADRLALRPDTVRRYLSDAYQKIGVRDRTQAALWCVGHGLVSQRELQQLFAVDPRGVAASGDGPAAPPAPAP